MALSFVPFHPLTALPATPAETPAAGTSEFEALLSTDAPLPAEVIDDIAATLASTVLPACWARDDDFYHGSLLLPSFAFRQDLTATAVETVVLALMDLMVEDDEISQSAAWDNYMLDESPPRKALYERMNGDVIQAVVRLVSSPLAAVPLLGTVWRTVTSSGQDTTGKNGTAFVAPDWSRMETAMVYSPVTPVEVSARIITNGPSVLISEFATNPYLPPLPPVADRRWLGLAGRQYPELAGLPAGIMLDTIASQPIPEEWFENKVDGLEYVTMVAPGVARDGVEFA